jgi:hypothetical protein
MKSGKRQERVIAIVMLAAMTLATFAPAAMADHGRGRYKGDGPVVRSRVVVRSYGPAYTSRARYSPGSVYIVRRSSNAGPVIAGFLGGLFLGATLANAAPHGYDYYDPYCDESFGSLTAYRQHLYAHHHPRIVRVIEIGSGDCVHSYRYDRGEWQDWENEDQGEDWND